jgi:hypothetical protein
MTGLGKKLAPDEEMKKVERTSRRRSVGLQVPVEL